jgi:hypothetical protein
MVYMDDMLTPSVNYGTLVNYKRFNDGCQCNVLCYGPLGSD